ncbi:MAG: hypothetical protein OHK0052_24250 [Anaerolineales bacterium]
MPLYQLLLSETPPHAEALSLHLPPTTAFLWIVALAVLLILALWLASQRPLEYAIEPHAHSHSEHHDTDHSHTAEAAHADLPAAQISAHAVEPAPVVARRP